MEAMKLGTKAGKLEGYNKCREAGKSEGLEA
jgi:hypothetical protein